MIYDICIYIYLQNIKFMVYKKMCLPFGPRVALQQLPRTCPPVVCVRVWERASERESERER
jgi:hypothetical protein